MADLQAFRHIVELADGSIPIGHGGVGVGMGLDLLDFVTDDFADIKISLIARRTCAGASGLLPRHISDTIDSVANPRLGNSLVSLLFPEPRYDGLSLLKRVDAKVVDPVFRLDVGKGRLAQLFEPRAVNTAKSGSQNEASLENMVALLEPVAFGAAAGIEGRTENNFRSSSS